MDIQPDAIQPDLIQPDAIQPDADLPRLEARQDVITTDAIQPDAIQPDAIQPDAIQPDAIQPQPQPVVVEQVSSAPTIQPDLIQPDPVQPTASPPIPGDMSQADADLFKSLTVPKAPQDPRFLQAPPKMKVVNTAARKPIDITNDGVFFDDGSREDYQPTIPRLKNVGQLDMYKIDQAVSKIKKAPERVKYLKSIGQDEAASYMSGRAAAHAIASQNPQKAANIALLAKGLQMGTATVSAVRKAMFRGLDAVGASEGGVDAIESNDAFYNGYLEALGADKLFGDSKVGQFAGGIAEMAYDPAMLLGGEAIAAGTKGLGVAGKGSQALYKSGLLSAGGAKLGGRILNSAAIGGTFGASDAALHSAAEGDSISQTVKNVATGTALGAALGGGLHAAGAAAKAGAPKVYQAIKNTPEAVAWIREQAKNTGQTVQSRLQNIKLGNDTLQKLTANVPVSEQVTNTIGKLKEINIDAATLEKLKIGGINKLNPEEQFSVIMSLPKSTRDVDMLGLLAHGNVMKAHEELIAFAQKELEGIKSVSIPGEVPQSGKMSFDDMVQRVGTSWNKIKKTELGEVKKGLGLDKSITQTVTDSAIPSDAKQALLEILNYKKAVFNKAQELAETYGLDNTKKLGYSHRHILEPSDLTGIVDNNAKMMERSSQSGKSRVVDITDKNVGEYSNFSVPHYVENFPEQHLGVSGKGSRQLVSAANKLPKFYSDLAKKLNEQADSSLKVMDKDIAKSEKAYSDIKKLQESDFNNMLLRHKAERIKKAAGQVVPAVEAVAKEQAYLSKERTSIDDLREYLKNEPIDVMGKRHAEELAELSAKQLKDVEDVKLMHSKKEQKVLDENKAKSERINAAKKEILARKAQQTDWFSKTIKEISRTESSGGSKASGIDTSGLKNIMRSVIEKSGGSKLQSDLAMDAASKHIDRMANSAEGGPFLHAVQFGQKLRNALNPGVALSPILDPWSMVSFGNTSTVASTLFDQLKIPQPKKIANTIGGAVLAPVKTIAKTISTGDIKGGASDMVDHILAVQDKLHGFMDKVNKESSLRDIAFEKPNARKFQTSMGDDVYNKAIKDAKRWLATPKNQRPEISGQLKQMVSLVSNEKLPTDMMGQTAFFNKLTTEGAGRLLATNQSFAANKLANVIGLGKNLLSSTNDPQIRVHALIALGQVAALTLIVEHLYFKTMQEAFRNSTEDIPDSDSNGPDILDIARFSTTPSVLVQAGKMAVHAKDEVQSWFSEEDKPDSNTLVNPILHDVSNFPAGAVRAAKEGYKSYQDYKKNPK